MAEGPSKSRALGTILRLCVIGALALLPVLPYAIFGYAGQDLPFHVSSWLELKQGWFPGHAIPAHFAPGWSARANFTLGDPHLFLYPPASFFLGGVLTLFLPLRVAPAAFAWLALFLAGVTMYIASRAFLVDRDRLTAAILYMLGPYIVATALVRFAAAELLVQAWLPLLALLLYRAVWQRTERPNDRALLLLGGLLGLTWITNIPASIVLLYGFLAVAAIGAWLQRSLRPLLSLLAAECIAASLAAFYLVPVLAEKAWISSERLMHYDPRRLLLFMPHPGFDDNPILVAFWIFLCVQGLIVLACLRKPDAPVVPDSATGLWLSLAAVGIFFQLPFALPLWQYLPELRFTQFPFRFLPLLAVAVPLLVLRRGTRASIRYPAYASIATLTAMSFLGFLSMVVVARGSFPPLTSFLAARELLGGAPEYVPANVTSPLRLRDPAPAAVTIVARGAGDRSAPSCTVAIQQSATNLRLLKTSSTAPCQVRLALYFYPYWRAFDEAHMPVATARDRDGLLLVDVPLGVHTISVEFQPASALRRASAVFSLFTVLLIAGALFFVPAASPPPDTP